MIELETFIDTNKMTVQGRCKKIRGWFFENDEHCVAGECSPDLVILFEDGTREKAKDLPEPQNCDD